MHSKTMPSEPPMRGASIAEGAFGHRIMELADRLAEWSDSPDGLTCIYLTPAHHAVAAELKRLMQTAGMTAGIDAVGNVVGRYAAADSAAKTLIVGSHYDTVVNAGKYDGRLGILLPLVLVEHLNGMAQRLPFHLEVIGFAEEEGVRFSVPYIGSSAVAGRFDEALLERRDGAGIRLVDAMKEARLDPGAISALGRRPADLIGYLEVHIEQGPVLLKEELPVGIVTSIAGNVRHRVMISGTAGHAGTVPMGLRHDAAAAAAEIVLCVERRCTQAAGLVGTVGQLAVPDGAINVIPGRCGLSLDVRASDDATRDAALADILAEIERIAAQRGVTIETSELLRKPAVHCSAPMQERIAEAVRRMGLAPRYLVSGAGHDAVMFSGLTEIGMLFVRCGNGGVSHSPLETITADDADVAAHILLDVLLSLRP
jgi:beta-ureidopropionase / N-carbamoyl-L-amino-acid hydrolase